ncbi:MAG: MFS transporter [Phycisphaerales bacterium]|nr:MFS transporter [Phycisphaerales bacterium]
MSANTSIQTPRLPNGASWINWGLGVLFLMSCVFSVVSFAVLAPSIAKETNLSSATLSALTSVFFFTYSIAQLAAGLLIDRIGCRWLLGVTTLIASVGGLIFISSDNLFMMYLSRAMMAIGLSSAFVGGLYLASKWFPASRFGVMSGVTNMAANLAGAIGSWLVAGMSYQPVVLWWAVINAGIAVFILVLVKSRVPQQDPAPVDTEDRLGTVEIFKLLFRSKQVWFASIFFTGTFGTFLSYADFWNIQIQQAYGLDISKAASFNALLPIGLAVGSVLFGLFSDKIRKVAFPCRICAISSIISMAALLYLPYSPIWLVLCLLFISGFCIGGATLAFPAAVQHCRASMQGAAIGLVTTCGYIGAGVLNLIVPAIVGPMKESTTISAFTMMKSIKLTDDQLATVGAFKEGMIPLMVSLALAAIASFMLKDAKRS